ncbi:MAG TPA: radical SAM protein [Syntrophales bacterium]|nr:radical SAM protein [Syntrophales bacterium]
MARDCNVQCNYCDRRYNCVHESRPGVSCGLLEQDDILPYLDTVLKRHSNIAVVGIAGSGDPFCNPVQTMDIMRQIHQAYPDLLLCLSTNGLNIVDYVDELGPAGVTHVTITINAVEPAIGQKIYAWMRIGETFYRGREAATLLWTRQQESLLKLKNCGITVKVNTVVIPGVNSDHIETIAECLRNFEVDFMNCIPLYPVPDTLFGHINAVTPSELAGIRLAVAKHIPLMRHCVRCRADAVGLLHFDRFHEFEKLLNHQEVETMSKSCIMD